MSRGMPRDEGQPARADDRRDRFAQDVAMLRRRDELGYDAATLVGAG